MQPRCSVASENFLSLLQHHTQWSMSGGHTAPNHMTRACSSAAWLEECWIWPLGLVWNLNWQDFVTFALFPVEIAVIWACLNGIHFNAELISMLRSCEETEGYGIQTAHVWGRIAGLAGFSEQWRCCLLLMAQWLSPVLYIINTL